MIYPKAPDGVSDLVKEAYTQGIACIRVGLTDADWKAIRRGIRRGELALFQDVNVPGNWRYIVPVVEEE